MTFQWATATHQGRVRRNNQDSVHPATAGRSDGPVVLVVADGMGGHIAGEVASRIAVDRAIETAGEPAARVAAANLAILEEVDRRPDLAGMGTTMTLVELGEDLICRGGHVGDSRAYILRDGSMRRLTTDHTVVNEFVLSGRMSAEEAQHHPQRNVLTRALGLTPDLAVDSFEEPLIPGDRLLLCSDGLTSMVDEETVRRILADGPPEPVAWALVEKANEAGGQDNITVVVIDVER